MVVGLLGMALLPLPGMSQSSDESATLTLGVCHIVANGQFDVMSAENSLEPKLMAKDYIYGLGHIITAPARTKALQQPKHGTLHLLTEADRGILFSSTVDPISPSDGYYVYLPEKNYRGKDSGTVLLDYGAFKVKVVYFFQVIDGATVNECESADLCKKGGIWEISSTLDASALASYPTTSKRALIIDKYTVSTGKGKETVTLLPGTFVAYDGGTDDGKIHISSVENYNIHLPNDGIWIPRNTVVTKDSFIRLDKWDGQKHLVYESIDVGADYKIGSDGEVNIKNSGTCGTTTVKGHLYKFQNFIWIRASYNKEFVGEIFTILPNGKFKLPPEDWTAK